MLLIFTRNSQFWSIGRRLLLLVDLTAINDVYISCAPVAVNWITTSVDIILNRDSERRLHSAVVSNATPHLTGKKKNEGQKPAKKSNFLSARLPEKKTKIASSVSALNKMKVSRSFFRCKVRRPVNVTSIQLCIYRSI